MSAHPTAIAPSRPGSDVAATFDAGGLIRRVRRVCDLSQRDLAERLGVHHSTVARWETNAVEPTLGAFARILALAGWTLEAVDPAGAESHETIQPMRGDAARDRQGRRYPAHLDLIGFDEIGPYRVRYDRPRQGFPRRAARREYRDCLRAATDAPPLSDHPSEGELARQKAARSEKRRARQKAHRDAYCDALVAAGEPDPRTPGPTCSCCDQCFDLPGCAPACSCRCETAIIHPDGTAEILIEEILW
ncbi:helix-turn-helix transcriptional regulator [Ammonicoccus fulvus]|uniref:Helix-turn-helix transcriptional regulator n=1 Tax=Ammonicoccus fulvus TaxID=3138240 RepID=A0ABZ3FSB9_9ACTN